MLPRPFPRILKEPHGSPESTLAPSTVPSATLALPACAPARAALLLDAIAMTPNGKVITGMGLNLDGFLHELLTRVVALFSGSHARLPIRTSA
jgi:hypothetical protein